MSKSPFEMQIEKITVKLEENLLGVVKNAIRKTVQEAQTPVAKGGKMRVDTGFLRWSGTASLNQMPSGPSEGRIRAKGEVGVLPEYAVNNEGGQMLNKCLIDMKIGDSFYFGWTARYALYREMYDGFTVSAVANFKNYVDEECRRLK